MESANSEGAEDILVAAELSPDTLVKKGTFYALVILHCKTGLSRQSLLSNP